MRLTLEELFDGFEVAADIKKISLVFAGSAGGWLCFMLFVWLGGLMKNDIALALFSLVGYAINFVFCAIALSSSNRMVYKELTTGEKLTLKDGFEFTKKNIGSVVLSPVVILLVIALALAMEFLLFMFGRFELGAVIISLLTAPAIMLNTLLLACAVFGSILTLAIISVDESGIIVTAGKIYKIARQASIPFIMYMSLALILGIAATAIIAFIFILAATITVLLFGTASQIFINLSAMDIPSLSLPLQAATLISVISIYLLAGLVFSYPAVLLQSFATSVYLKIKELVK
ncbi:MAG: hypothetical protein AABZ57_06460 [Candidatus Margulisiibacteriota bacterium]